MGTHHPLDWKACTSLGPQCGAVLGFQDYLRSADRLKNFSHLLPLTTSIADHNFPREEGLPDSEDPVLMREKFRQQPSQSKERQGVQLLVSKLFFGSERLGSSPGRSALQSAKFFFLARCCLGQVPGRAPFSQRSEQATASTNRTQIRN